MTVSFEIFLVLLKDLPFAFQPVFLLPDLPVWGVARAIQALSLTVKYQQISET